MKGTITYKRDFTGYKTGQLQLFDIGGNARSEHGQTLDEIAEWNVDAYLNNEGVHSRCNETVCTMTESIVAGDGSRFGYGLCAGEVLWSYTHVHSGTLGGKIEVNGVEVCYMNPRIGTDPNNTPGNEQGYLVGVEMCVDYRKTGKKLRLNKGDVVKATAWYNVDPKSTQYFPAPGGKHGGIMALHFAVIECDEGTWGEVYVRRNDTCIGAPRSKSHRIGTFYNDRASCEAQTDPQNAVVTESPIQEIAAPSTAVAALEPNLQPQGGKVDLVWRDCGSPAKLANITKVTPDSMGIGLYNNLEASGVLTRDVESANFSLKMSSGGFGLTLMDFSGDACNGKVGEWTLAKQIHLSWLPMKCPVKAGDFAAHLRLFVDPAIPVSIAHTTTTVLVHDQDGAEVACAEVITQGKSEHILV